MSKTHELFLNILREDLHELMCNTSDDGDECDAYEDQLYSMSEEDLINEAYSAGIIDEDETINQAKERILGD